MLILISSTFSLILLHQGTLKYRLRAKSGPRIDFVNNEKLIDETFFDFVEYNITRNNHIT